MRPPGFDGELGPDSDERLLGLLSGGALDLDALADVEVLEERPTGWVERNVLPGGRWQLAPDVFVRQLRTLEPPPERVLIPGRQLRTLNSELRDVAAEGERKDVVEVHLAPLDADRVGVEDGDRVCVRSPNGELVGPVHVDESLRPGAVWVPHGWLEPNVGRLTSRERGIDPLTGMVLQSGVAVELERLP